MKNIIYTFAFCIAVTSATKAQRIYQTAENTNGTKDVVSVLVPEGWVQDNQRKHGVHANNVLVKTDEVGEIGNGKIFIQTIPMEANQHSVDEVIAHEKMMYATATTKVKETAKVTVDDITEARVITVTGSVDAANQLIAFIPLPTSVIAVTLSTPYGEFMADHMADFEALLKSFQLNPHLKTTPPALLTQWEEKE
jgi:hypothetical protein